MNDLEVCYASGPQPGNAGDMVTPWLLGQNRVKYKRASRTKRGKHLMCGSIAVWAEPGDTLWGTGNSHESIRDKRPDYPSNLNVRAVRGPLTRERLLAVGVECPEIYGDPALLLPKFYRPKIEKKHKIGVVPHYVDLKLEGKGAFKGHRVISPRVGWAQLTTFIDRVCECERIISSSLHGVIIAHAYGIPARWVVFSPKVFGNGLKFRDYLLSIGHVPYEPTWPSESDWRPADLNIDIETMWKVRPFDDPD